MPRLGVVYKITNPAGAIYIGSTIDFKDRTWIYRAGKCKNQTKLYESIQKYGWEQHKAEIIWEGNESEMHKMERLYGEEYSVLDKEKGLNAMLPGYDNKKGKVSQETIDKFIERSPIGIPLSRETKEKMSKNSKRHAPSIETLRKSVLINGRKIVQLDKSGNFIKEFANASVAAKEIGVGRTSIKNNLTGGSPSAGGFVWKYADGGSPRTFDRRVIRMDKDGNELEEYGSMADAGRAFGIHATSIRYVIDRGGKTAAGFRWKQA